MGTCRGISVYYVLPDRDSEEIPPDTVCLYIATVNKAIRRKK